MNKILEILCLSILISSCSNPENKSFNEETFFDDALAIIESNKYKEGELNVLGSYIVESKLKGNNLKGLTYSEIQKIAEENFQNSINKNEPTKEEFNNREKFNNQLMMENSDIGYTVSKDNIFIIFDLQFENKSNKTIKSEIGTLLVPDLFVSNKGLEAIFENGIKPGEKKRATIILFRNPFNNNQRYAKLDFRETNIKYLWLPKEIIFEDNTSYK